MSGSNSGRSPSQISPWDRLKNILIADVPEDMAICEFDCAKSQCSQGEWSTCKRRFDLQAVGYPEQTEAARVAPDASLSQTPPPAPNG